MSNTTPKYLSCLSLQLFVDCERAKGIAFLLSTLQNHWNEVIKQMIFKNENGRSNSRVSVVFYTDVFLVTLCSPLEERLWDKPKERLCRRGYSQCDVSMFFGVNFLLYNTTAFTFCDISISVDVMIHEMNELAELLNPFNC